MNKLDEVHYLPVFLKPVKGKLILFNPVFAEVWKENSQFLRQLKLRPLKTPYLNNFYFSELMKSSTEAPAMDYEEALLSFGLQSISLPEKITEEEYYALMHGNYLAVTEKFLSHHVCGHVASSRHILLKNIQVKGVGRTASTQQLSYPNMNGFIQTGEAVRGYYNGQLLKVALPYGAVNVQAVVCVLDHKLHSSLVIRDAISHRLAQIEPSFLSQKDKLILKQELETHFPGLSSLEILDRVLEQHLCLWIMGVEHPMNVDNLALAGFPMDEEDMRPGHEMQHVSFDFNLKFEDESLPLLSDWKALAGVNFSFYSGINHRLGQLLRWYDEAIAWLCDQSLQYESYQERKIHCLRKVFKRFYQDQDVEAFINLFQKFETNNHYNGNEALALLEQINDGSNEISISDLQMQHRVTVIRAKWKMRLRDDVRGLFNQLERSVTEKIVKGMGRFEMSDYTYSSDSALVNSSQLHRLVNRQAFSLAAPVEVDEQSIQNLLEEYSGGLAIKGVTVFTLNGFKSLPPSEMAPFLIANKEIILVDLTISFKQQDFVLPMPKAPLHYKPTK